MVKKVHIIFEVLQYMCLALGNCCHLMK